MLTFNYWSTSFSNKVVLTKFISACRMIGALIWCTPSFYKSKTKKVKRGGKSAIWPNWCCQQSITILSTPPSSICNTEFSKESTKKFDLSWLSSKQMERTPWNFQRNRSNSRRLISWLCTTYSYSVLSYNCYLYGGRVHQGRRNLFISWLI